MEEFFRNTMFQLSRIGISPNTLVLIIVGIVVIIIVKRSVSNRKSRDSSTEEPETESTPDVSSSRESSGGSSDTAKLSADAMAAKIMKYSKSANWNPERTGTMVTLTFDMNDDRSQAVFVNCFDSVIEIVGMIPISYEGLDEAPHDLSNTMMEMNAKRKTGFWAIKDVEENHYYCLMINVRYNQASRENIINMVKTVRDGCDGMVDALLQTAAELS